MRHLALLALLSSQAWGYTGDQIRSVTTSDEAKVNQVREQEIGQLRIVLGRRFAESRRPDLLLRLAELYVEEYRFFFFKENQVHQKLIEQGAHPRYVEHSFSRDKLASATKACLAILQSRVSFAKMDEVYYFLGYNAEELGNRKEATRYFGIIVSRYPQSTYAPEAYRNLAEDAFERRKYPQAVADYEQAARFTQVASYPRTLYKLAWAYFKTRRKAEALDVMKRVVSLTGTEEKFVGLREEALGDLVVFFSEAGKAREAHEYFSSVAGGPEIYSRALSKLSGVYERRGDYRLALQTNATLVSEYGDRHPDLVYEALGRDVELHRKLGDGGGETASLKRLVRFFHEHTDELKKNEDARATLARARQYLLNRAADAYKTAQKKKNPVLYGKAADLYGLYLDTFPDAPDAAEVRGYRADALLAAGREQEALPELERRLHDKNKTAGAILLNIRIKRLDAARASSATGPAAADAETRFLAAADEFESAFPDDPLVAELRFKRARLVAAKSSPEGLSKDARKALSELIAKYPQRAESAEAAHDLVADALKHKDEDEAVELARGYLGNHALMAADKKGALGPYLSSVILHRDFSGVQGVEKDKDYDKAATQYESLALRASGDPEVSAKALHNAAINFERAGKIPEAVRVHLRILARNPKSAAPREDLKRLASLELWKSRYPEAAALYAQLAGLAAFPRAERVSFAHTAFELWRGMGDGNAALASARNGSREICAGGSEGFCLDLPLETGRLLMELGKHQEALDSWKGYLSSKGHLAHRAEAAFLVAQVYKDQLRDARKAGRYLEEASQAVPRTKPGKRGSAKDSAAERGLATRERNVAAHAAFLLVEPDFAQFSALKLELPESRLKAVTRKKLERLESLVTRYLGVVSYGDGEWGIAALERLYDAFSAFAGELEQAPVPPGFNPAKTEAYRRGIRQVSGPMASRAREYLRLGYQDGLKLGVTTPTFVALTQRLARSSPREFPPAHFQLAASQLRLMGTVPNDAREEKPESLRKPDNDWRREISAKLAAASASPANWVELGNLEALSGRTRIARLFYEQAVSLNPKDAAALGNLAVVLYLEGRAIEAVQDLARAAEIAEFSRDARLNLARIWLAYHHFEEAEESLTQLSSRLPEDREVSEALAVATLGAGRVPEAGSRLEKLDARSGKAFSLWYNWSVWAFLAGDKSKREKALDLMKDRRGELGALEASQVDLVLSLFGESAK